MRLRNRWKKLWLSLAAGQSMVPFGDNGPALRELSQRIWALRAAEAAKAAAPAPTNAALLAATRGRPQLRWIDRARSV